MHCSTAKGAWPLVFPGLYTIVHCLSTSGKATYSACQHHSNSKGTHLEVHELLCMVALLEAGRAEEGCEARQAHIITVEVVGHGVILVGH